MNTAPKPKPAYTISGKMDLSLKEAVMERRELLALIASRDWLPFPLEVMYRRLEFVKDRIVEIVDEKFKENENAKL